MMQSVCRFLPRMQHKVSENDKKSTGIGLYLCKKLCLRLNHEIKISSNEKTTVTIIFPHSSFITLR